MPEILKNLLTKIANLIINPLILLGFIVSTIYVFYYIVRLIYSTDGGKLEDHKKNVGYGILGLVIMFSVYGILRVILNTIGLDCNTGWFFCK